MPLIDKSRRNTKRKKSPAGRATPSRGDFLCPEEEHTASFQTKAIMPPNGLSIR
jgi:hypothetical protein